MTEIINHKLDQEKSQISSIVEKYDLDNTERLILLLAIAPFYSGSPHAMLRFGQDVDIERYAQEIIKRRNAETQL